MSTTFAEATAVQKVEEGRYGATIPNQWQQGKGAFGGVVVGLLSRALLSHEAATDRPLRSLSAEICAPAQAVVSTIEVGVLRRGMSMSFLDARLIQSDSIVAHATACVGKGRDLRMNRFSLPAPTKRPDWRDVPVAPVGPPLGPVFGQHYEFRLTGPFPFSGGKEPFAAGYIRERVPPAVLDTPAMLGLLDTFWPTAMVLESAPRPMVTVGYTAQLLVDPRTLNPAEPLYYRAQGVATGDSYFVEMRELWSGDTVVALNQQTFAVLG